MSRESALAKTSFAPWEMIRLNGGNDIDLMIAGSS